MPGQEWSLKLVCKILCGVEAGVSGEAVAGLLALRCSSLCRAVMHRACLRLAAVIEPSAGLELTAPSVREKPQRPHPSPAEIREHASPRTPSSRSGLGSTAKAGSESQTGGLASRLWDSCPVGGVGGGGSTVPPLRRRFENRKQRRLH